MTSTTKGGVLCGRSPFSRFSGGYTLVETLAVMMILAILAGAFTIFYGGLPSNPEKEAQQLARWLTNLATISNRSGQSFSLYCPGNVKQDYIEVTWQASSKKDVYAAVYGCVFNRYSGSNTESLYSPQWSALVPTITIEVSGEKTKRYVIVSQHGRVRTSSYPAVER